ncbi:MAG: ABC transporter substrate-binding protein [Candidatus Thioglobus sp.]|nr:ABC transporter substrate-binding protein [Candidatus Thioglobus sp.]MBT4316544.1 ABC transporter substrate-binding protein [Candidatus Thioglobus sp.]
MFNYKHIVWVFLLLLSACTEPWNNPYPASDRFDNTLYNSFRDRPKHLDPARSYSSNEWTFIQSVYETPLQYHYLKRPYTLIPGVLTHMPEVHYYDDTGTEIDAKNKQDAVFSEYILQIKQGVMYQNHPAFVKSNLTLSDDELTQINALGDITQTATRELVASDFVHQIKRLANPLLHSPIFSLMAERIVGLSELNTTLTNEKHKGFVDLEPYHLEGVKVLDKYRYSIKVKGIQEQFLYWLAMPFFTAVPPEADRFYSQAGLIDKNIILDWYPIGTGPFQLSVNNPNKEMILERNLNFHGEYYPKFGQKSDIENGLLLDQGKKLPFLNKVHFLLEKETTPYWNKFLQGYYDQSGISSDNFDQAIEVREKGKTILADRMSNKNIRLLTSDSTSIYYTAFNMLDSVVGGYSESAKKLRQAISIAINEEESISIFRNGRGRVAHGPIPAGIFGHIDDYNPFVYEKINGVVKRKDIAQAKDLLAQAGYGDGIDPKTNKPLVLYFDTTATDADDQSNLDWIRKQFKKLGIQLVVRPSSYNRLQDKMSKGQTQLFGLGWNADYPDPENFLFLLYGKNSKVETGGENASNYQNSSFDALFEKMKNMPNSTERQAVINKMVLILREDAPWIWGFIPKSYGLYHEWLTNSKPHAMARNTLKYLRINPKIRDEFRTKNNQVVWWPMLILVLIFVGLIYRFRTQ